MTLPKTPVLGVSRFTEFLVRGNELDENGFGGWLFYPGMLLGSRNFWWGKLAPRGAPHEGIDLCYYRNGQGTVVPLDIKTKIPAICRGKVVKIMNDFIGQSIVIEHHVNGCPKLLLTIYGHMAPAPGISVGRSLTVGDIVGNLAAPRGRRNEVRAHLHLSLLRASVNIPYGELDWNTIHTLGIDILDPLDLLDGPYSVVDGPEQIPQTAANHQPSR